MELWHRAVLSHRRLRHYLVVSRLAESREVAVLRLGRLDLHIVAEAL